MSFGLLKPLSFAAFALIIGGGIWIFVHPDGGGSGDLHSSGIATLKAVLKGGRSIAAEGTNSAAGTPTIRMRGTMWDAKTDAVDKKVSLSIPLEDRTGEIVGIFQTGCESAATPTIFLRVGVSKKLGLFSKTGNQQVAMFNEGYNIGTNSFASVTEVKDFNIIRFFGASRGVSLTDPSEHGVEDASNIAQMIRRIHRSNLSFQMTAGFGEKFSSSIAVEGPSPMLESHAKLFESVAAYCIDLVK